MICEEEVKLVLQLCGWREETTAYLANSHKRLFYLPTGELERDMRFADNWLDLYRQIMAAADQ